MDEKYVGAHVEGYEEVASSIERCTPEWGEEATGIPAALIGRAARMYASGPSLLWLGQGLQRQPQGGNVFRACAMLPALTGNIGKPGAGFYYLNDTIDIGGRQGAAPVYEEPRSIQRPGNRQPDGYAAAAARSHNHPILYGMELQPDRFESESGPDAAGTGPRGSVHGRDRLLYDGHGGPCRYRSASSEFFRVR